MDLARTLSLVAVNVILAVGLGAPAHAKPKDESAPARAECARVLAAGNLDGLRIAWTQWQSREMSTSIEIKHGKLLHYGGALRNSRKERALTDAEKKELMAALVAAHVDRLVWINRDVKNDMDRVLNVDVLKAGDAQLAVGAFVRTHQIWHSGATRTLADLLEKWLGEKTGGR